MLILPTSLNSEKLMLLLLEILKVQLLRVMKRRSGNQGVRPGTCQVRRDSLWGRQPSRVTR